MTKTKSATPHVIVVHGSSAKAVIKSLNLAKGTKAITVNDAIDQWILWLRKNAKGMSTDQKVSYIQAWARDAKSGTMALNDVEEEHINEWVNADDGTKLGTRRVRLAIVRGFFKYCAIKELLTGPNPSSLAMVDFNALSHKQKETGERVPFTNAEFEKLVDYLESELEELQPKIKDCKSKSLTRKLLAKREHLIFWKSSVVISRCSGLRLGDICQLEWATMEKGFTVWTDKRNKRVTPHLWNKDLFEEAIAQIPNENPQYCFPVERAIYLDAKRRSLLNVQFGRLCERLGMAHTFHDLRSTYATECDKEGIPTPHIARSLGHSSTRTTDGYIKG